MFADDLEVNEAVAVRETIKKREQNYGGPIALGIKTPYPEIYGDSSIFNYRYCWYYD